MQLKFKAFSFISGMTERRPAIHKSNTQLIISVTVTQYRPRCETSTT